MSYNQRLCDIDHQWKINADNSDAKCHSKVLISRLKLRNSKACKDCPYNNMKVSDLDNRPASTDDLRHF